MQTVIGIGSPHGDDSIGWCIVEQLRSWNVSKAKLILAREPSEILNLCEGARELHLVDASVGSEPGCVHRISWPDPRLEQLRWTTTHGVDVPGALALASALDLLPDTVTLWCIECDPALAVPIQLGVPLSRAMKPLVELVAKRIQASLVAQEPSRMAQ